MTEDSKKQTSAAKRMPPNAGKGRKKGVPNKNTRILKDAILQAAVEAGEKLSGGAKKDGIVEYLKVQAIEHPPAFLALMGKILPTQNNITATDAEGYPTEIVLRVVRANDATSD